MSRLSGGRCPGHRGLGGPFSSIAGVFQWPSLFDSRGFLTPAEDKPQSHDKPRFLTPPEGYAGESGTRMSRLSVSDVIASRPKPKIFQPRGRLVKQAKKELKAFLKPFWVGKENEAKKYGADNVKP